MTMQFVIIMTAPAATTSLASMDQGKQDNLNISVRAEAKERIRNWSVIHGKRNALTVEIIGVAGFSLMPLWLGRLRE